MIYIKRFNLAFIKIPKNASTSFSNYLIETLVTAEDTYTFTAGPSFDLTAMTSQNIPEGYSTESHLTYAQCSALLRPDTLCYGIIRHPLERMLSLYIYRLQQHAYGNMLPSVAHFRSLVKNGVFQDFVWQQAAQTNYLTGAKHKRWMLYDNLDSEVSWFAKKYNISTNEFPRINSSVGDKQALVHKYFDEDMIQAILSRYKQDFELYEELKFARTTRLEN